MKTAKIIATCGLRPALLVLLNGSMIVSMLMAQQQTPAARNTPDRIEELAGNAEVAEILRCRPGRGVMADNSSPTPPNEALSTFRLKDDLSIELIASEPAISQPLFLTWDSKGRLWVVQYRQYQYPAGLKVVQFDQHLRAVFDKIPAPPPNHVPGADVITMLEDTDGDGVYDRQVDAIKGLNIATSVAIGHGGIWVLNPPYLLFYPDPNQDGLPDADPQVHLSGFGLQDTHSVANSLLFGPDGWLYGANGSTTGGTVVSSATPSTTFEGQCIWRYHPGTREFEIFAEGGGNTFSLDIDAAGRTFSGTNGGGTRGWHYPQGSYAQKNWGKHGPLTNPFAFGFFNPMKSKGDDRRFPQAFLVYDGGLLGQAYAGSIIAPNSMCNLVWHSLRSPDGSTFQTVDLPNLLDCTDRWFRPVFGGVGPDGAIYLADWYDTRLSHVSPVDDWHKNSGRIYRIAPKNSSNATSKQPSQRIFPVADLSQMTTEQLIESFRHPNKWVRQRAALEIGWRADRSCADQLEVLVREEGSLEALWALSNMDALDVELAASFFTNENSNVRTWAVRLLGDRKRGHAAMVEMARVEPDVEVRSQLAATARRIETEYALPIIAALLLNHDSDVHDPHMPLMIWWAMESHAKNFEAMFAFLQQSQVWQSPTMQQFLAERIMQRYASAGAFEDLQRCARLLELPLDSKLQEAMIGGLNRAFQGRTLPLELPPTIQSALKSYRQSRGTSGVLLAAEQGDEESLKKVAGWLADPKSDLNARIEAVSVLGRRQFRGSVEAILAIALGRATHDPDLQRVALQTLANFDDEAIGAQIVTAFDSTISGEHQLRDTACRTLAVRKAWAMQLLQAVNAWTIRKKDIPADVIVQLRTYPDEQIQQLVEKAFGKVNEIDSPQLLGEIQRLKEILQSSFSSDNKDQSGPELKENTTAGEKLFADRCGKCHQLFGKGEAIGPKLDSYDRTNLQFWLNAVVAPSLEIREGYQMYQILTTDGRVVTGIITSQDLNAIVLRGSDGQSVSVTNAEIEKMQAIKASLMPEGVLNDLSQQQLVQLFSYLASPAGR